MILKKPKVLHWTSHAYAKMRQYGLSQSRIRRILHSPTRIERGIAEDTIAYMQRAGSEKHPHELWTMIADKADKRNVVSAWRYPGITKKGEPLPAEIMRELSELI
jgi:hypothetical protein